MYLEFEKKQLNILNYEYACYILCIGMYMCVCVCVSVCGSVKSIEINITYVLVCLQINICLYFLTKIVSTTSKDYIDYYYFYIIIFRYVSVY